MPTISNKELVGGGLGGVHYGVLFHIQCNASQKLSEKDPDDEPSRYVCLVLDLLKLDSSVITYLFSVKGC